MKLKWFRFWLHGRSFVDVQAHDKHEAKAKVGDYVSINHNGIWVYIPIEVEAVEV
jgi:hypothetical protein